MNKTSMPNNYCHNWGDDGANWSNRQQYLIGENLTYRELLALRVINEGAETIKQAATVLGISSGGLNSRMMKLYHRGLLICHGRKAKGYVFSVNDEGKRRMGALSDY